MGSGPAGAGAAAGAGEMRIGLRCKCSVACAKVCCGWCLYAKAPEGNPTPFDFLDEVGLDDKLKPVWGVW